MKRLFFIFAMVAFTSILFGMNAQMDTVVIASPGEFDTPAHYVLGSTTHPNGIVDTSLFLDAPIKFLSGASGSTFSNPHGYTIRFAGGHVSLAQVGVAVWLDGVNDFTISGMKVDGKFCGAALLLIGNDIVLKDSKINNQHGCGVEVSGSKIQILNCDINTTTVASGIFVFHDSEGVVVKGNNVRSLGSAFYLFKAGNNVISDNEFDGEFYVGDCSDNNVIDANFFTAYEGEYALFVRGLKNSGVNVVTDGKVYIRQGNNIEVREQQAVANVVAPPKILIEEVDFNEYLEFSFEGGSGYDSVSVRFMNPEPEYPAGWLRHLSQKKAFSPETKIDFYLGHTGFVTYANQDWEFAIYFWSGKYEKFTRIDTSLARVQNVEDDDVSVVFSYSLSQNYPNPFNPETVIEFNLKQDGMVTLDVFNSSGQRVARLVNESLAAGSHKVRFNTTNLSLSSGVYFYQINAGDFVATEKMAFTK